MADFDKEQLQATVDGNGIAWISYPGPPYILWQFVEVNPAGDVVKFSSQPSADQVFEPIIRAQSAHWRLAVQFCGDGRAPDMTFEVIADVAAAGVNALAHRYPSFFGS